MSTDDATPDRATIELKTSPITFPDEWTLSGSWQRAQTEEDHGGPINDAERMVYLDESDDPKRCTFVLVGRTLRTHCSCDGYHYRDWCAHIASLWWRWIRGEIAVSHLTTEREYQTPPDWLRVCERGEPRRYDGLTPAELEAFLTCELGETGVREYARKTNRAPGTLGNLLRRAHEKVGGQR
jgi:hypothetical protein